jgi:two-component system, LuxR family, sensor kinase FixL
MKSKRGPSRDEASWTADAAGLMTEASARWLEIIGLTPDAAAGSTLAAVAHPDDRIAVSEAFAWSADTGAAVDVRHRVHVSGGEYRWVRTRGRPRRARGRITGWRCTAEDVHAEALAEHALVDSEARLRTVLENIGDAVIAFGPQPGRGFANRAFLELFGVDIAYGTIEGAMRAVEILDADGHPVPHDERPMLTVLRGERVRDLEARLRFADGRELDIVYNGQPVFDADGKVELAVLTMRDVTAAKAAAAELRELNHQLAHVSRVGAMGSVASAISHELAQPLTVIANTLVGARLLLSRHGAEAISSALDEMINAQRATRLARDILDRLRSMIRQRGPSVRREPIQAVVDDALLLAAPSRAERARIAVDCPKTPIDVLCDKVQIQQVLMNLLRNAAEAAVGRSGGVELTVEAGPDDVTVSVLDDGAGIAPAVRAKLFQPFNSSKPEGTGIGLSICKNIIDTHGGRIWAEDRPTGGSAFRFTLPRA